MGRSGSRSPRRRRGGSPERRRRDRRGGSRSKSKSRSRSPRDRDRRRERDGKRDKDARRTRDEVVEIRRRSRSRSKSREQWRRKGGKDEEQKKIEVIDIGGEEEDVPVGEGGASQEEAEMMRLMGFGGFDTTKGKKVSGNDVSAVHHVVVRKYRQYMNRRGGFNRPLDFVN